MSFKSFSKRKIPLVFFLITVGMQSRMEKIKKNHKIITAVYILVTLLIVCLWPIIPFKNVPPTIKIILQTHPPLTIKSVLLLILLKTWKQCWDRSKPPADSPCPPFLLPSRWLRHHCGKEIYSRSKIFPLFFVKIKDWNRSLRVLSGAAPRPSQNKRGHFPSWSECRRINEHRKIWHFKRKTPI